MVKRRKGTPIATKPGGVQVVKAPGAFSAAQQDKAKRPGPSVLKRSLPGDGPDTANTNTGRKRPRSSSWEREYKQIWKSVNELGAEQFTGKAKKAHEARKIVELGGRAPKEAKMPYPLLMELRKKAKARQKRQETMEAEAGLVTGSVMSSARKPSQNRRGSSSGRGGNVRGGNVRGGSSFGPAPSMGMMKSGVLRIGRNAIPSGAGQGIHGSRGGRGMGKTGGRGRGKA